MIIERIKYISLFIMLTWATSLRGQSGIDSILNILDKLDETEKAEAFNDLAYEYFSQSNYGQAKKYAESAIEIAGQTNNKKQMANGLNMLGLLALNQGEFAKAQNHLNEAIALGIEINNASILANAHKYLGHLHYSKSDYQQALKNWMESQRHFTQLDDKQSSAQILQLIGVIYKNWGDYNNAISFYQQALAIYNELNDETGMAKVYANLGNIYYNNGIDYDNALENYRKALPVFQEYGIKKDEAQVLNNIGLVYLKKSQYDEALKYFESSLKISIDIDNDILKAQALNGLGDIYLYNKNYSRALDNYNRALEIFSNTENKKDIALILKAIGGLYYSWGKNEQSKNFYLKSIGMSEELDIKKEMSDSYRELAHVLFDLGEYKQAFQYYEKYSTQKDSIFSKEYSDMMSEWSAKLENAQIREQQVKLESELKKQKIIVYSAVAGILIVLIFSSLLYKQYWEKQKANILLHDQNEEIKSQRDKIFEQNKEITDSIEYASKIQSAMLPPDDYISKILPEHFVLYRPRDIVSGDFYWLNKYNNKVYICAADCTGHGVPGAFMSMLGIALLNEIINKKEKFTAADILNNLRAQVVNSMHQQGTDSETQDGMDIAFCILDMDNKTIQFSGAFNPLFIVRQGELLEFKGDKMPIGVHIKQHVPFTNHNINFETGDNLYIFSDGYVDQFGGPKRKKFLVKRFRELLVDISSKNMPDQQAALENVIDEWMGAYEQIDDILVFGAKL